MELTRRYFLRMCGGAAVAFTFAPMLQFVPDLAAQDTPNVPAPVRKKKTLVVIFLRGGQDGLHAVVPYGDPDYAGLRPRIHLKAPTAADVEATAKCLDLDGFFGLHPRAWALMDYFRRGELAILPTVGNPRNNRSHFTQQDMWETAEVRDTIASDGWLNRHLQTSVGHGPLRAVAISNSLPRILRGQARATAIRSVADLAYQNRFGDAEAIQDALRDLYEQAREMGDAAMAERAREAVEDAGRATLEGLRVLEQLGRDPYTPSAEANYPANNGLATRLRHIAQLVKADVGLEVAQVDLGGWDTHQNQGDNGTGAFGNLMAQLADAMAAFARDLGDKMDDVLVVTLTEFGRTARENGTAGTDHGHAGCLFALGGAVKASQTGGKVVGEWPGLSIDKLNARRDLTITVDFRDVFGEILTHHLGNPHLDAIIPNHTTKPIGLLATAAEHPVPPSTDDPPEIESCPNDGG